MKVIKIVTESGEIEIQIGRMRKRIGLCLRTSTKTQRIRKVADMRMYFLISLTKLRLNKIFTKNKDDVAALSRRLPPILSC